MIVPPEAGLQRRQLILKQIHQRAIHRPRRPWIDVLRQGLGDLPPNEVGLPRRKEFPAQVFGGHVAGEVPQRPYNSFRRDGMAKQAVHQQMRHRRTVRRGIGPIEQAQAVRGQAVDSVVRHARHLFDRRAKKGQSRPRPEKELGEDGQSIIRKHK